MVLAALLSVLHFCPCRSVLSVRSAWSSPHQTLFRGHHALRLYPLSCLGNLTDAVGLTLFVGQVKSLSEPKAIGGVAIPGSTLVKLIVRWTARINAASKAGTNSDAAQDLLGKQKTLLTMYITLSRAETA